MKNGPTGRKRQGRLSQEEWVSLVIKFLATRDRTSGEVQRFLERRGASASHIKLIINRLVQLGYLNDRAYAERWIASRLARRPMGRERLKAELMGKGIDRVTVEELLRSLPDEVTVARSALDLLGRKRRLLTPMQVMRRLHQQGFDEETISRLMTLGDGLGSETVGGAGGRNKNNGMASEGIRA
ncbi:MAG: RecX family transcriptional regulator [Nitrospira sp.]|nr:RecX family transcriptional regulator [Nitrospira sp.]MCP9464784.1 RecX family transcriptional regulator [Nitrospira sp.]